MREIFKHKSVKAKKKSDKLEQAMDIVKLNKFNFLRKKLRNLDNKAKIRIMKTGDKNRRRKS